MLDSAALTTHAADCIATTDATRQASRRLHAPPPQLPPPPQQQRSFPHAPPPLSVLETRPRDSVLLTVRLIVRFRFARLSHVLKTTTLRSSQHCQLLSAF